MAVLGFVGLGNMGSVLAANLVAAGHTVIGHDVAGPGAQRRAPRASASTDANDSWKPISRGAPGCASATAIAASASVRSTSVRRPSSTASNGSNIPCAP